jgi:hypothetical protein
MSDDGTRQGRGISGLGLWRLLPYAGVLLLVLGNVRHGLGGHDDHEGPRTVFFALFLAAFIAAYARPSLVQPRAALTPGDRLARRRTSQVAATCLAWAALIGSALCSQSGWLPIWVPRTGSDWELVTLDLAAAGLYILHFHAVWTWGRDSAEDAAERG